MKQPENIAFSVPIYELLWHKCILLESLIKHYKCKQHLNDTHNQASEEGI